MSSVSFTKTGDLSTVTTLDNVPSSPTNGPSPNDVTWHAMIQSCGDAISGALKGNAASAKDMRAGQSDASSPALPDTEGHASPGKVDTQSVHTSGAQQAGQKILTGASDAAGGIKKAMDDTIGKIPLVGKVLSAPMDLIAGTVSGGLKGASDAVGGNSAAAKEDVKNMASGDLATISGSANQLGGDLQTFGKFIPEVGPEVAAVGGVAASLVSSGATVGQTALDGGDVDSATADMGKNVGMSALNSVERLADPMSGFFEKATTSA